ncbi:MAG: phosphatidate cytidylyltransferase [Bifidobacteriaceae bacterium]|jgi:phosphatidate cytidylyltransferase|nr:phosphatidate cytidylyltransferase [Bifidobacteriaceae bacterium]
MAKYGKENSRNIPLAIIIGVSLFLVIFASLFITPYFFLGLVFITCTLAVSEIYYCLILKNIKIGTTPIIIGSAGMFIVSFYYGAPGLSIVFFLTVAMLILYCSLDHIDYKIKIKQVSYSVLVCAWLPFLLSFMILLYCLPYGAYKVALSVVIISFIDMGGLVVGSKFGKNRLAPNLSPKKSWEGLVGGFLFGLIIIILGSALFEFFSVPFLLTSLYSIQGFFLRIVFVIVIGFFGLIGDLAESALKRFVGIKDMGAILPGHGGIMDRIDSCLIAAPALYLFFIFFG